MKLDFLPNELISLIFINLDIYDLKNMLFLNKILYLNSINILKKKKLESAKKLIKDTNLLLKNHYYYHNLENSTFRNNNLNILNNMLLSFTYFNNHKSFFKLINPNILSFFLYEWVSFKNNNLDELNDSIGYSIAKFRTLNNEDLSDYVDFFDNLYSKMFVFNPEILNYILICH